jgi:oligoribonuclease
MDKNNNWVWLDLEMTGLDPEANKIIEIATIVTDCELNVLAEGPVIAIHQPQSELDKMDAWNVEHHGGSGLIDRVKASRHNAASAEAETLAFLQQYVAPGSSPLCGNTVSQDRRFMVKYMPALADFFHYRHLDVSTLKILAERWAPAVKEGFKKESTHQALLDIRDSIEELRYYRKHLMSC